MLQVYEGSVSGVIQRYIIRCQTIDGAGLCSLYCFNELTQFSERRGTHGIKTLSHGSNSQNKFGAAFYCGILTIYNHNNIIVVRQELKFDKNEQSKKDVVDLALISKDERNSVNICAFVWRRCLSGCLVYPTQNCTIYLKNNKVNKLLQLHEDEQLLQEPTNINNEQRINSSGLAK